MSKYHCSQNFSHLGQKLPQLELFQCSSTFPAFTGGNAPKSEKALGKVISKISKISHPICILNSFKEFGRLPGPLPLRHTAPGMFTTAGDNIIHDTNQR